MCQPSVREDKVTLIEIRSKRFRRRVRPSLLLFLVLDGTEVAGIVPVTATHGATSATGTVVALTGVPNHDECCRGYDRDDTDTYQHRSHCHCDPSFAKILDTFPIGSLTMMKYNSTANATIAITRYAMLMSSPTMSPPNCTSISEHTYANTHW